MGVERMQKAVWLPEDIARLHEVVAEAAREGRSREDAFKQFAQERGIKSVNAVRYQWIASGFAAVGPSDNPDSYVPQDRAKAGDEDVLDVLRENAEMKSELKRLRALVSALRRQNTGLRRENKQLMEGVHAILHAAPQNTNPVLVISAGSGRQVERLAQLFGSSQREA